MVKSYAATVHAKTVATTKRLFGRAINPHLFRDCVATFVAEDAPDQVKITHGFLAIRRSARLKSIIITPENGREKAMRAVIYARYRASARVLDRRSDPLVQS
jgi:hypothetical protein